jgi:hypothetical protein
MIQLSARKLAGAVVALALGAATPLAVATPAAASDPGAAIAAGIGGFALGALAGSAARPAPPPPYYGAPAYYPAPVYEAPPPYRCWRERRPVFDEYGVVIGYRPTRVCE